MRVSCVAPIVDLSQSGSARSRYDKEAVEASNVHILALIDFHLRRSDRGGNRKSVDAPVKTRLGCTVGEAAQRQCSAAIALTLKVEP